MILKDMSPPDVDALDREKTVVLYPVASCEQHSLHLPVYVDSMICEEVAARVHALVPEAVLVLPGQYLGYSQHHIKFPGTLSSRADTFANIMLDTVSSVRSLAAMLQPAGPTRRGCERDHRGNAAEFGRQMVDNGFKKVLIMNAHGGNGASISVLLQQLMEIYPDCEFYSRFAWGPSGELNQVRTMGDAGSGHAGETETSMILAIKPVRIGQLE